MAVLRETNTNQKMIDQVKRIFAELLAEALRSGFYGTAEITLKVHDGTIHEIRHAVERVER